MASRSQPANERRTTRSSSPRRTKDARAADREPLTEVLKTLVEALGRALPPASEVILHDLDRLPHSIIAVYGDVTGRGVGDPATDLLLKQAVTGFHDSIGYRTQLADGRQMRSSTLIIHDLCDEPTAALCINIDISAWASVENFAHEMVHGPIERDDKLVPLSRDDDSSQASNEMFASDVDQLAAHLVSQAIERTAVPVEYMKKEHKLEIVRDLKGRGLFLIREAVEMVAEALQVTRFTIYNYLNELSADESSSADSSNNTNSVRTRSKR